MKDDKIPQTRFRCKECQYIGLSMSDALQHRKLTQHEKFKEEEYTDYAYSTKAV